MAAQLTPRCAQSPAGPGRDGLLRAFTWVNRHLMLPMLHNRHVHTWVGSPVIGYFLVLTTAGRRTRLPRRTPLNYAILDGHVYVLSGFSDQADWYRNLEANPHVTLALPGRVIQGTATAVVDPVEAQRAALAVARNCGFALVFEGMNPLTATDDRLTTQFARRPVVRIKAAEPIVPGWHDPGSPSWLLAHVVAPLAVFWVARTLKRQWPSRSSTGAAGAETREGWVRSSEGFAGGWARLLRPGAFEACRASLRRRPASQTTHSQRATTEAGCEGSSDEPRITYA